MLFRSNIPIQVQRNSELNLITQEKYKDIIKLINNSLRKKNKIEHTSSPNKYNSNDLKKNDTDKRPIYKSKSNINFNNNNIKIKNRPLTNIDLTKRKLNKIDINNNANPSPNQNISTDRKNFLFIEDKLTLEEYEFKIPEKYKNQKYTLIKTLEAEQKKIYIYNDNKKEIFFPSGVRKEIFNDGYQIVYFVNGDIKQTYPDGKSIYYFHEAKTVQTTFINGVVVYKFGNNQLERHYPDGKKQIIFPDGSERIILSNGYEETFCADRTIVKNNNGKTINEND